MVAILYQFLQAVSWQFSQRKKVRCNRKKVIIQRSTTISSPERLYLSDYTRVGDKCYLDCSGTLEIGAGSSLAPRVVIYTSHHRYEGNALKLVPYDQFDIFKKVVLGNAVWIGHGAMVMPGVKIGDGSVIGAGSVVTKDIPPFVLAAGNPCCVVKSLDSPHRRDLVENSNFYIREFIENGLRRKKLQ